MSYKLAILLSVLSLMLVLAPAGAQSAETGDARGQGAREEDGTEAGLERETEATDEGKEADQDEPPPEHTDEAPDAVIDPLIARIIKRHVLIDKPDFRLETGGKVQVQYYVADSEDPDNEDDLFLRRLRPYLIGHFKDNWIWKAEVEIGADIT